ncbi:MAG: hypothetical protein E1N59_2517 [Puniceicoccaceae bacterium 5H]|nr:MAG: hypothetical protein E1N59_2517 [Puniceicoccaceae bacterium 5H]
MRYVACLWALWMAAATAQAEITDISWDGSQLQLEVQEREGVYELEYAHSLGGPYTRVSSTMFLTRGEQLTVTAPYYLQPGNNALFLRLAETEFPDASSGGAMEAPIPLDNPTIKYPAYLRDQGIEGTVTLIFVVRADGGFGPYYVEYSDHPYFTEAVIAGMTDVQFLPAMLDLEPINAWVRQTFPFVIL